MKDVTAISNLVNHAKDPSYCIQPAAAASSHQARTEPCTYINKKLHNSSLGPLSTSRATRSYIHHRKPEAAAVSCVIAGSSRTSDRAQIITPRRFEELSRFPPLFVFFPIHSGFIKLIHRSRGRRLPLLFAGPFNLFRP